ncbi:MAG: serine hydrolase, partial [Anaerolineales bacterium]|nr:serine hydrolase [Anaerolineales bacterium]
VDVEASLDDVTSALYRPTDREAFLTLRTVTPERPGLNLLARLIVNSTQEFEQVNGGLASVFVLDLETGDEISLNADVAMSGMGLLKTAIALEAFRVIDQQLSVRQSTLISDTLLAVSDENTNQLLGLISGVDDPVIGAANVTQSLQTLGLVNSYIVVPYGTDPNSARPLETPANSVEGLKTTPTAGLQTTAEDMGSLLAMIYHCAQGAGGAIEAAFAGAVTQAECRELLDFMSRNEIGSLLEQGVPDEAALAHRHGWIDDTHGDAGIVTGPSGSYVIVEIMYKPSWLEWEISSPLIANISQATYNFFNFDSPFAGQARSN